MGNLPDEGETGPGKEPTCSSQCPQPNHTDLSGIWWTHETLPLLLFFKTTISFQIARFLVWALLDSGLRRVIES